MTCSFLMACQNNTEKTQNTETEAPASEAVNGTEAKEQKPDYSKLILGRWVMPADENGFEPWAFYDAEKVYGDGNEQGTEYQIEGDKMIYRVLGGGEPAEYKIITLNETTLTLQLNEDTQQTWTKADMEEEAPKKEEAKTQAPIDAKLLVGTWVNEQETDEFSKQRVYKTNGKMDLTPFDDIYTYKVEGNIIKYTKHRNDGSNGTDDVITSLSKTNLVLNGKLHFKRTK